MVFISITAFVTATQEQHITFAKEKPKQTNKQIIKVKADDRGEYHKNKENKTLAESSFVRACLSFPKDGQKDLDFPKDRQKDRKDRQKDNDDGERVYMYLLHDDYDAPAKITETMSPFFFINRCHILLVEACIDFHSYARQLRGILGKLQNVTD